MFELIGLAVGAFIGFLVAGFLQPLDALRNNIRQLLSSAREKVLQMAGPYSDNPLIALGAIVVLVVLVFWLLSFSSAMLLGIVLGVVYKEEVGQLPFVSGIAEKIKQKISGPR